ncbi:MAG: GNAT family N-acetyltransferase [Acidimicrobiales bacterium]
MRVRLAETSDAEQMARAHIAAWQAGYRGMMPDKYLDGLDLAARTERWRSALATGGRAGQALWNGSHETVLVVEDHESRVVGLASIGATRDDKQGELGELWMLNIEPGSWSQGLGRQLLEAAEEQLRQAGYREAVLWVLDVNGRARRFYERAGWWLDGGKKSDDSRGFVLREVSYRKSLGSPGGAEGAQ